MGGIAIALLIAVLPSVASAQSTGGSISRPRFIADMRAQFVRMDADGNGQLTAKEIETYQQAQAVDAARARNRAIFAELDKNKDGKLSAAEFDAYNPPPNVANAQVMLGRMDSNRDQQVSADEHRVSMLVNFDRLDSNRDGIVSAAEMKVGGLAR